MRKTVVLNLATGGETTYINDLSPTENIITDFMLQNNLKSGIDKPITRNEISKKIIYGQCSASIGNLAVQC